MKEAIDGSSYSAEARQARKKDLRGKLNSRAVICKPQNVEGVRLSDLATKITSYKEQYFCTEDPQEKKVIGKRLVEVVRQTFARIITTHNKPVSR
jgi:hypothetical protein